MRLRQHSRLLIGVGLVTVGLASTLAARAVSLHAVILPSLLSATRTASAAATLRQQPAATVVSAAQSIPSSTTPAYNLVEKIDGSRTPDHISDETAELHLLRAASPGIDDKRLKHAKNFLRLVLSTSTLPTAEAVDDLISTTKYYNLQLDLNAAMRRDAWTRRDTQALTQYGVARRQLLASCLQEMTVRLGPDGGTRIRAALEHIKLHTSIVGTR